MTAIRLGRIALALVAAVFIVGGLRQAWTDSPTVDEGTDLASGLSHLVHRDLRSTPEHPPLPQVLAAAPALFADPIVPAGEAWESGDWFAQVDDVMSANDEAGQLQRVVFLSRLVPILETLGCAVLLFWLGRRFAGESAGLIAAGAWLTTPVVLGLGHFQSIDVAFTLTVLLTVTSMVAHRDRPSSKRAALVGVTLAVTLASRHTGLVLVPVALAVVAQSSGGPRAERLRQVGVAALVGWLGLWLIYRGFDLSAPSGPAGERFEGMIGAASDRSLLARIALLVPAPLEWQAGLAQLTLTSGPRPAYLFGQAWEGNKPWFFPGSLVAAAPLPVLGLLLVGPWGWLRSQREQKVEIALVVLAPLVVLFVFVAVQPLALGLRLALPSLALWTLLAATGAVVGWRSLEVPAAQSRPWSVAVITAVAVVQIAVLVSASTNALPWRPLAFRPAYRWVSDSNVDFGQDLYRVRAWSEAHDEPWVAVIGPRGLQPGEGTRALRDADPAEVEGWVAVGVTALTVVDRDDLAWLRAYCPLGTLGGGSTLIYRFERPPDTRPGPDRPVAPCAADAEFSTRPG